MARFNYSILIAVVGLFAYARAGLESHEGGGRILGPWVEGQPESWAKSSPDVNYDIDLWGDYIQAIIRGVTTGRKLVSHKVNMVEMQAIEDCIEVAEASKDNLVFFVEHMERGIYDTYFELETNRIHVCYIVKSRVLKNTTKYWVERDLKRKGTNVAEFSILLQQCHG